MSADRLERIRANADRVISHATVWAGRGTRSNVEQITAVGNAIDSIDELLQDLYRVRETLISENRVDSDERNARVDRLLSDYHDNHSG